MQYQIQTNNDVFEATLSSKITFSDLEGFREMIDKMVSSEAGEKIVDLSEVEFIDSAGLGMLLLARDEVEKTSGKLTLRSPRGQVKRMFEVARFDKMFDIDGDE